MKKGLAIIGVILVFFVIILFFLIGNSKFMGKAARAADNYIGDWISGGHNYSLTGTKKYEEKRIVDEHTNNNSKKDNSDIVAHNDTVSYFHKYSYGITEVGNANAGSLIISQDGHKLETTLGSSPIAYGHNFHSIFGIGKYHFYGVVTYKGNHYYILNNMAGGGQDYVALWQIAWRNSHGGFSVSNFFGTENPNVHVSVDENIIKLRMNGPHGTVTYHVNMDKLVDNVPTTYSSLNRKLNHVTNELDADYKNAISTMTPAQAQEFQESEINWIIKKRKFCGTTAEEIASRSKSDVTCQIKMGEQRIAQISSE